MSTQETAEQPIDTESVSGLGEILPEPLQPLWRPVERVQRFRRTHGETYITVLEAIVAVMLAAGYVWWAYLYVTG
ncbi:hypothetical protein GWK26_06045 [haloarchaeon 3A1-DGR]|nr:hypothetical protein GWK26_06045 [haloarchaeon 3A1-DGR]